MKMLPSSSPRNSVLSWRRRLLASVLSPLLAAASLLAPARAQTPTSAVPALISYQGKVSNANGTLVGAGTPVNRIVVFRIWSHQSNSTINELLYSEQQTVTVSEGEFSVLIGQGSAVTGTPLGYNESSKNVIGALAVFGGAMRYLGVTIDDGNGVLTNDPEISPRQQLVSSAFAMRAKFAESLGSNGTNSLIAADNGFIGIGAANPAAKLDVAGNIRAGGVANASIVLANADNNTVGNVGIATSVGALSTDAAVNDVVVSAGAGKLLLQAGAGAAAIAVDTSNRVGIGTSAPNAALDVNGALMLKGALTNASGRPTVGTSRVAAEIGGYGIDRAFNDDGFLRLSAGGGTTASTKSFVDLSGFSTVADMDRNLVFGTAGAERMRISNTGALLLKSALTNSSSRPAVASSRLAAEIAGNSGGDTANDVGFLRLSAGGGTNPTSKSFIDLTGYSTVADMDKSLAFGTAGAERMRITSTGNVGVGTSTPAYKLDVVGSGTGTIMRATDGTREFGVAFSTSSTSGVRIGSKSDHPVGFYTNDGTPDLYLATTGRVGVGVSNPTKARLEVGSGSGSVTQSYIYLTSSTATTGSSSITNGSYSIWASGRISSVEFNAHSDRRIKLIKGLSDGASDLSRLMEIEVTDYDHKDQVANGSQPQKKVIGQQVEAVFPQAVTQSADTIPDIFRTATVKNGWVELATDLKPGDRVKLVTPKASTVFDVAEVERGRFRTTETLDDVRVFVYGREVKDFRTVDYDAIAMLNVSATQQIKREKDAEIAALTKRVAELEAKDRARDAKLAAIEKMISSSSTVMALPAKPATANGQQ